MEIPESFHDVFDKKTFAHLSTRLPDGSPHVTPVWVDYDATAGELLVNTERGRRKERNVQRTPEVGMSMTDPDDPYRFLSVAGSVSDITTDGAIEHINELTQRYMDQEEYPQLGEEEGERVILRIEPENVRTS